MLRCNRVGLVWMAGCTPASTGSLGAAVDLWDNGAMGLEKRFTVALSRPERVILGCTSPDDPLEDHALTRDGSGELRLYGLLPDTSYDCTLADVAGDTLWTGSFATPPLPDGFPELVTSGDADQASIDEGYLLFTSTRIGVGPTRAIAADGEGRIRWYREFPEAFDVSVAASWVAGQLVVGGSQVIPAVVDLSGDVVFDVGPAPPSGFYHHEAKLTPLGLLSLEKTPVPPETDEWNGFRIEVTSLVTSEVVWSFDSETARAAGLLPDGGVGGRDPYHANAVSWRDDDPEGPSVWVSMRAIEQLMRIDRTTGEMTLVGHDNTELVGLDGEPLAPREWFWGQHAPDFHGDAFVVFDNGNARPHASPRYSRVAKYRRESPDVLTLLWEWSEPDWFEPYLGSATELPDGHVLVGSGHTRTGIENSWILELDPEASAVLWRLDFASQADTLYRAQAIDGCDLFANRRFCR